MVDAIRRAKLRASDAGGGDRFGTSVSLSGDTAVVGAPEDDTPAGPASGSAYVFVRSGTAWTERAHLFSSDVAARDRFGYSVALSADTAVVGSAEGRHARRARSRVGVRGLAIRPAVRSSKIAPVLLPEVY